MQVTVVGCSPAWPNPGAAQSGYLVEGRGRLLLDCGPGVLARLREHDGGWPNVDAVVITHFHHDHWGDLVPWVFGAAFGPGRGRPRPQLWLPPGGTETLRSLGKRLAFAERIEAAFEPLEYRPTVTFAAGGFEVTPMELDHYEESSFGLRVANASATLAYSSDTGPTPALVELARDADLLLCEATLSEPDPAEPGHLTARNAQDVFVASGARRLVVIHRPAELSLDAGIELAHDGDVFRL